MARPIGYPGGGCHVPADVERNSASALREWLRFKARRLSNRRMALLSRLRLSYVRLLKAIACHGDQSTCSDDIRTIYSSAASMFCERWCLRSRTPPVPGGCLHRLRGSSAFGPCRRSMMTSPIDGASLGWRSRVRCRWGAVLPGPHRVEFKGPGSKCFHHPKSPCPRLLRRGHYPELYHLIFT